jgi:phage baseplate assembly protein W
MAFQVEQINPLDLQPRKAVGVSLPFSSTSVFNSTYTTQDALKSNIVNYCLTEKNERFLNPDFGAGLRRLLFEPGIQDNTGEMEAVITSGIATWFPDVKIETIDITVLPDTNTTSVFIKYSVINTNIQDQVVINFEQ